MLSVNPKCEKKYNKENHFSLFTHKGLICVVMRMWRGHLNGYVAVGKDHPLYGKDYSDKVHVKKEPVYNGNVFGLFCSTFGEDKDHELNLYRLDMALNVHGGLTYARNSLSGIDESVFPEKWWFGFDTSHAGDMLVMLDDIDRKYNSIDGDDTYRDMEYVIEETKALADQLTEIYDSLTQQTA